MDDLTREEFLKWLPARDADAVLHDLTEEEQAAWIDEALDEADAELKGYAAPIYATPLVVTVQTRLLKKQLAQFALLKRRPFNYSDTEQKAEAELRGRLEKIAQRKFALIDQTYKAQTDKMTSARETRPSATTTGRRRTFTRKKLTGF